MMPTLKALLQLMRQRLGPPKTIRILPSLSDPAATKNIKRASRLVPPALIDYINMTTRVTASDTKISQGSLTQYVQPGIGAVEYPTKIFTDQRATIAFFLTSRFGAAVHELGHGIQHSTPGVDAVFHEFHKRRWRGGAGGKTVRYFDKDDQFLGIRQLPSKPYPTEHFGTLVDNLPLEIFPHALEFLLSGDEKRFRQLTRDEPELYHLIIGTLLTFRATNL